MSLTTIEITRDGKSREWVEPHTCRSCGRAVPRTEVVHLGKGQIRANPDAPILGPDTPEWQAEYKRKCFYCHQEFRDGEGRLTKAEKTKLEEYGCTYPWLPRDMLRLIGEIEALKGPDMPEEE